MNTVSLVRVDTEWHVFREFTAAWAFYDIWRGIRDCECILDVSVDESTAEQIVSLYASYAAGEGGITTEGTALGHRYVMGNVNAYCPKCSEEQGVTVLDCYYDLGK